MVMLVWLGLKWLLEYSSKLSKFEETGHDCLSCLCSSLLTNMNKMLFFCFGVFLPSPLRRWWKWQAPSSSRSSSWCRAASTPRPSLIPCMCWTSSRRVTFPSQRASTRASWQESASCRTVCTAWTACTARCGSLHQQGQKQALPVAACYCERKPASLWSSSAVSWGVNEKPWCI